MTTLALPVSRATGAEVPTSGGVRLMRVAKPALRGRAGCCASGYGYSASRAWATSSARVRAPVLASSALTWFCTVFTDR